ncbi:unnamed protein product [Brassica oleracea]
MGSRLHAFMYPCFASCYMIPYLHLANKLAEKGHHITYLLPKKAQKQLESLNLFLDSIFFHPLTLPPVEGLHVGVETTADLPPNTTVPWIPEMTKEFEVKSVIYQIVSTTCVAIALAPGVELGFPQQPGYPSSKMVLRGHDANLL